jgi:hypothetical protein
MGNRISIPGTLHVVAPTVADAPTGPCSFKALFQTDGIPPNATEAVLTQPRFLPEPLLLRHVVRKAGYDHAGQTRHDGKLNANQNCWGIGIMSPHSAPNSALHCRRIFGYTSFHSGFVMAIILGLRRQSDDERGT